MPVDDVVFSVDNQAARRTSAELCNESGLPHWSCGSSFFGGYARYVHPENKHCASPWQGIEQLDIDYDDEVRPATSCSAPTTPMPSSVLPQMALASWVACQKRSILLGETPDPRALARGIEIHLNRDSRRKGYEGLRWSPGRGINVKANADKQDRNDGQRALPHLI